MDERSSVEAASLSEKAYRHLLSEILAARLPAGAPIQERRLAAEIGLSRSPVRDALGRLTGEGLVVRSTAGLLTVRTISLQEYLQSLDVRVLVEPAAAALAADKVVANDLTRLDERLAQLAGTDDPAPGDLVAFDDDLHGTVAAACGNLFMARTLTDLRRYTGLYERQTSRLPRRHADAGEHRAIVAALVARSPEAAGSAMKVHLAAIRDRQVGSL